MIHPASTRTPWADAPTAQPSGPRIRPGAYTEEMLTESFDAEFLRDVQDPADFLQARRERLSRPTPAVVRGPAGVSPQPVNPLHLSTAQQAEKMLARLRKLGVAVEEITEVRLEGPFSIDYGDDPRRPYQVGGMNVGALLSLYATYPEEVADQMVLDEWRRMSVA